MYCTFALLAAQTRDRPLRERFLYELIFYFTYQLCFGDFWSRRLLGKISLQKRDSGIGLAREPGMFGTHADSTNSAEKHEDSEDAFKRHTLFPVQSAKRCW